MDANLLVFFFLCQMNLQLGSVMEGNFLNMLMPTMWPEFQQNGISEEHYQQWFFDSVHQPIVHKEESHSIYTPEISLLSSNSSAN